MKIRQFIVGLMLLAVTVPVVLGQIVTNQPTNPAVDPFPVTREDFWKWTISAVTPVIIWAFAKIPNIPRPLLPVLTPFVGILLGWILKKLSGWNIGWVDLAQAGTVAVFIRESVNQLVTKQLKSNPEETKTPAKPVDGAIAVKPSEVISRQIPTRNPEEL